MPLSALCVRSLLLEWVLQARDGVRVLSETAKAMGTPLFPITWLCDPLVLIMIPPNGIATGRSPCLHTQDEQQQTGRCVKLLHPRAKSEMSGQ